MPEILQNKFVIASMSFPTYSQAILFFNTSSPFCYHLYLFSLLVSQLYFGVYLLFCFLSKAQQLHLHVSKPEI